MLIWSKARDKWVPTFWHFKNYTPNMGLPLKFRRSEEHTSELQSRENLVCRLLLEKKNIHSQKPTSAEMPATIHFVRTSRRYRTDKLPAQAPTPHECARPRVVTEGKH